MTRLQESLERIAPRQLIARLSRYSISRTDLGINSGSKRACPPCPYNPRPRIAS